MIGGLQRGAHGVEMRTDRRLGGLNITGAQGLHDGAVLAAHRLTPVAGAQRTRSDLADQLIVDVDEGAEQAVAAKLGEVEVKVAVQLRGGLLFV